MHAAEAHARHALHGIAEVVAVECHGDPQHQSIFLRADEDVPFGAFATVMDAVKGSGITNVSIVTQPLESHAQH